MKEQIQKYGVAFEGRGRAKRGPINVTFFGDEDVIASLAADGNANLHTVTPQELKEIVKTGLLFAKVDLAGPPRFIQHYADGRGKLALIVNDTFVEPVQAGSFQSVPRTGCQQTTYLWSVFGSYRFSASAVIPITTSCDPQGPEHMALEFAFNTGPLPPGSSVAVAFGAVGSGSDFVSSPIPLNQLIGTAAAGSTRP